MVTGLRPNTFTYRRAVTWRNPVLRGFVNQKPLSRTIQRLLLESPAAPYLLAAMDDSTPSNDPVAPSDVDREPPSYDADIEDYAGISDGALGGVDDVHAAREFAEMIVDTIREGLLVLGFDLRVRAANESFYDQFGVQPEETVGHLVYDLGNGQWDIPELRELLERILPQEQTLNDYEVEHAFEGLGRRVLLLNARRMNDHELILLALEDITVRRADEEDRRERERLLAEQQERQRIAHVLHDDLQQVLFGARLAASLGNTEQLEGLLGEALELTRTLSHSLSPPFVGGGDIGDLLPWVAERHRALYGLEVEVQLRGDVSVPDPSLLILLHKVVRELLFNVAKHAGTDRVRLIADEDDGNVRVVVEDEGTGFDPAALDQASGMGLPSVRERLEVAGGLMKIESAPGEGTRVTITVPVGETFAEDVS